MTSQENAPGEVHSRKPLSDMKESRKEYRRIE